MGTVNQQGEPAPDVLLAVDGGNSKTDVLLADTSGRVLGHARGGGTNHQTAGGLGPAMARLDELVRRAGVTGGLRPALAAVYLAGADLPSELAALTGAVTAAGWAGTSIVDNDAMALLRTGTEATEATQDAGTTHDGTTGAVAVVCGAGINCVARATDGREVRFPSLGAVSGDWGGGQHLGSLALWHAARAEDGRGPATSLVEVVTGHFDLATVAEVCAAIHLGTIPSTRLGSLAPLLCQTAATGDQVARCVVLRQAEEVVLLVTAALRRLDLLGSPVAVVLGGGVLRARHPLLCDAIHQRLSAAAPLAKITVATDPPVLGAAFVAMDALGAGRPAYTTLRAAAHHFFATP